ncbi:hypothetical protein HGM15179_015568 [Zosterops borbonicus]|uniref:Reverse transcriptase domain-containing protein n=1 Tax=Zosterops borbonicus TaxID=364589 RepID=A0A8K1LF08_9PASS|nr:hypothetical protein HGM15179_015568 [Zosterops borbonicus]
MHFSPFLWQLNAGLSLPSLGEACSTPETNCPRGGITICHGLIQTALEKCEALEHLQYINDMIVWGNMTTEILEKKIIPILLETHFAIKKSKVTRPTQKIQFLGLKEQNRWHQIPTDVINKITTMPPPTKKKSCKLFEVP